MRTVVYSPVGLNALRKKSDRVLISSPVSGAFSIFAVLLVLATAAFILPPLGLGLRAPKERADRKTANLAIFRDQLAELERETEERLRAERHRAYAALRTGLVEEAAALAERTCRATADTDRLAAEVDEFTRLLEGAP